MRVLIVLMVLFMASIAYGDAGDVNTEQIMNRVWNADTNQLKVTETNRTMGAFKKVITFGEMPITLSSDTSISWVSIRASNGNTGNITIAGHATLSEDDGYILDADEIVDLKVDNLTDIYVFARFSGDSVSVIFTTR